MDATAGQGAAWQGTPSPPGITALPDRRTLLLEGRHLSGYSLHMVKRAKGDFIPAEQPGLRQHIARHLFQQLMAERAQILSVWQQWRARSDPSRPPQFMCIENCDLN
jgi:hypothetical protein